MVGNCGKYEEKLVVTFVQLLLFLFLIVVFLRCCCFSFCRGSSLHFFFFLSILSDCVFLSLI